MILEKNQGTSEDIKWVLLGDESGPSGQIIKALLFKS